MKDCYSLTQHAEKYGVFHAGLPAMETAHVEKPRSGEIAKEQYDRWR